MGSLSDSICKPFVVIVMGGKFFFFLMSMCLIIKIVLYGLIHLMFLFTQNFNKLTNKNDLWFVYVFIPLVYTFFKLPDYSGVAIKYLSSLLACWDQT